MADLVAPKPITATNPKTGEKIVFRDGGWHRAPQMGQMDFDRTAPGAAYLPKDRIVGGKSEEAYFRKWRETNDPKVTSARSNVINGQRMENLLSKQETGGWYSVPVVGDVLGLFDDEIREMDAIQSESARKKRIPGEGATSDFESKEFIKQSYGKDKPTQTNRNLIRAERIADDAVIQQRQFKEWYYNSFGTVAGAEEAWDRYAQDNPIMQADKNGVWTGQVNANRKNWRQYFGATRSQGDARPTQQQQDMRRAAPKPQGSIDSIVNKYLK